LARLAALLTTLQAILFQTSVPANSQHLALRIPCLMPKQKPLGGAAAQGLFCIVVFVAPRLRLSDQAF